jgi:hypothetical protein
MKTQPSALRTEERKQEIQPCYLYRFNYSDGTKVFFTTYDQDVTISGGPAGKMTDPQIFTKAQIKHERPNQEIDGDPTGLTIHLGSPDTRLRRYFLTAPTEEIGIEIYRVNSAALPGPVAWGSYLYLEFKGIMTGIGFNNNTISGTCITLTLSDDRSVPNFFYSKTCQYQLYRAIGCTLNENLFKASVAIANIDRISKTLEIPIKQMTVDSPSRTVTFVPDTFFGGIIKTSDGFTITTITAEILASSTRLYLTWWPPNLANGDTVTVYLGCNRLFSTCKNTFRNQANYPGQPYIPTEGNPAVDGISLD